MSEILLWTLIVISVGLTIQFVTLSLRHENLLREHTRAIRELSSKGRQDEPWDFTEKIKGIYKYVQIIAWIGVFFCVCVCIHYLCGYCPRTKFSVEADYIGIVIGILSAMITLLVGWQIFSNIKERERFDKISKENHKFQKGMIRFRNGLGRRIDNLDKCCKDGRTELIRLDEKIDVVNNASLLFVSAQGLIKASKFENKNAKTDSFMLSMAYSTLWQAVYQFMASRTDKRNVLGCISQMKSCLMMLSIDNLQLIKEQLDMADKLYEDVKLLDKEAQNPELMDALREVISIQKQIGYDKEWEERRAAFARFEEQRDKIEAEEAARQSSEANGNPNGN